MPEAAPHAVSGTVLVEHKDLAWTEPAQGAVLVVEPKGERLSLHQGEHLVVVELARVRLNELIHAMLPRPVSVYGEGNVGDRTSWQSETEQTSLDSGHGRIFGETRHERRWLVGLTCRTVHLNESARKLMI